MFCGEGRGYGQEKRVRADDLEREIVAARGRAETECVLGVGSGSCFHGLEGDRGEAPGSRQGEQAHPDRGLAHAGICADKEEAA